MPALSANAPTLSATDQAKTRLSARFVFYQPIYPPNDFRVGLAIELIVGGQSSRTRLENLGQGSFFRIIKARPDRTPSPLNRLDGTHKHPNTVLDVQRAVCQTRVS